MRKSYEEKSQQILHLDIIKATNIFHNAINLEIKSKETFKNVTHL